MNKSNEVMRDVPITRADLARVLRPGTRCDFVCTPIEQLVWGAAVVLPSGEFRRFLFAHGATVWVSDGSGCMVERHQLVGSLYRAEVWAGALETLRWSVASCMALVTWLPTVFRPGTVRPAYCVAADPSLLQKA